MVESIAETDEALTVKFLEGEEITVDELKAPCAARRLTAVSRRSAAVRPTKIKASR
jgi:hypothetical protein